MRSKVVGVVALVSAGLASVCCISPLIVTSLGLGGLGLLAGLTRYRSLFMVLTALVLAFGFYLAYRKRSASCGDGSCEMNSGRMKAMLWIVTALAATVAAFPKWSAWFLASSPIAAQAGAQTLTLKISGMDCAACAAAIKRSVENVPGVLSASIDFDAGQATVITNAKVDAQAVVNAVATAGYKAAIIAGGKHGKPSS